MNKNIKLVDAIKYFALIFMFLYFIAAMVFSYKTEYFKISHIVFAIFAGFVILYRITRLNIAFSKLYIYMIVFVLFATMSYYWAIEKSVVSERVSSYFSLLLLSVLIINIIETPKDLAFAFKAFAISGGLMCAYTFLFYGFDEIKMMMLEGARLGQEINEANSFGFICGISFTISTCYAVFDNKKIFYILSVLLAVSVIMTGSRTATVGIVFSAMLIVILNATSKKIVSTAVFVIAFAIVYNLLIQSEYFQMAFQRFELLGNIFEDGNNMAITDNSTETRLDMMRYGLLWFKENPILGYGVEQYSMLYEMNFGRRRPAHNFHIQMLVEFGIIGFIIWEGMFISIIKDAYKTIKKRTESKVVFITVSFLILMGFGYMFTYDKIFWITLGLCFSYFYVYRNDYKKEKGQLKENSVIK